MLIALLQQLKWYYYCYGVNMPFYTMVTLHRFIDQKLESCFVVQLELGRLSSSRVFSIDG